MKIARALAVTAAVLIAGGVRAEEASEKAAATAAGGWLKLVDAGQYAGSWDEAARLFKGAVLQADWVKSLQGARSPLGRLVARKVASATFAESLPGAPDGKYVVVQYQTIFENKKAANETVTMSLEKDGQWRVAGYFIK